jgi:hypothetical protein
MEGPRVVAMARPVSYGPGASIRPKGAESPVAAATGQDSLTAACIILRTALLRKWWNWQRLRSRGLGTKRSLALREFA